MAYRPRPIKIQDIQLSRDLLELTERLAEHAHDIWAQQRIADGWTYGPRRDDAAKQHPCLVTYVDLPESEKEYDRQAALGILKAIQALGYAIAPVGRTRTTD
jgi:ryanodine receptor 2